MVAPGYVIHAARPLNWLLDEGCDVTFLDLSNNNPITEHRDSYKYLQFPSPRGSRFYGIIGDKAADWMALGTQVLQLQLLNLQIKPDITHIHWIDHHAYKCMKAGFKPLVLSVLGSDVNQFFFQNINGEKRRLVGRTLAVANTIIVDAPDMIEKCNILAGCETHTVLLPMGIDMKLFRPTSIHTALEWRRKLKIPPESTVLFSPRGWKRIYRHEYILEAFAKALPRLETDTYLIFKKSDMIHNLEFVLYEKELLQRAHELGVTEQIRLIPWVPYEQLPEIYGIADVILNYPYMDAFPVTFIEAAACEKPVISCRLPAYLGTFAEKYFRMVDSENIGELADIMVEELNSDNTDRREKLIKARRAVEQEYDEKIYIKGLLNIYTSIV